MKKEYNFSKGKRGQVGRQLGTTRVTIHLDNAVLEAFRERADATGRGYQTMIDEALREHLGRSEGHVDAARGRNARGLELLRKALSPRTR
jgi:uncharacterized protein (DUF4415 family)